MWLYRNSAVEGPLGAQQWPDPLLTQAICRACNPLGKTDDYAGYEGGHGMGPRIL